MRSCRRVALVGIVGGFLIVLLMTAPRAWEQPPRVVDTTESTGVVTIAPASVGEDAAISERRVPPGSAPTAETDAAWRLLRVRDRDQVAALLAAPQNIAASRLFRSRTFNPRDRYLPPAARQSIAAVAEAHRSDIEATTEDYRSACTTGFERLHREGRTIPVRSGPLDRTRSLRKIGPDPIFMARDGVRSGVSLNELPDAMELRRKLAEQAIESCVALTEAFATAGCLDPAECAAIVEQVRASVPAKTRRR
ncbi:MAG: hypothetical protein KDC98_15725 [Planctomycetes bacterium]|nr:hypothetical protein [Planctomycetota bacterium]